MWRYNVVRRVSEGGFVSTVAGKVTSEEDVAAPTGKVQDAVKVQMMSPATVSADIDGTL